MQQRLESLTMTASKNAEERDLSPSQRDRFVAEAVDEYKKPEMIRQAIKMVKTQADVQAQKR